VGLTWTLVVVGATSTVVVWLTVAVGWGAVTVSVRVTICVRVSVVVPGAVSVDGSPGVEVVDGSPGVEAALGVFWTSVLTLETA
jgi:hypothetical protein